MDIDVTKYHSKIDLSENDNNEFNENLGNGNNSISQRHVLTPQEITKTFRIMAFRKCERQARGRYRRRSLTRTFWFIMFMMLFLSLMGAGLGGQLENVSTWKRWPEFGTLVALFMLMMYVYYKITEVVRWCFYWLAIATIILLIINQGSIVNENKSGFASTYETRLVLIVLGLFEALTLIIWVLIRYGYPKIVKDAYWLDTIWWWRIKQDDDRGIEGDTVGCFRYFGWESYSLRFRHGVVKYVGQVDENGLPHGPGEWVDDSFDGECLKGSGTGDAFYSVRVGLVKNRHTPWDEWRLFPKQYQSGIDACVASIECSVSGKYLKYLPRATIIIPPKFEDPDQDDNESYISPIEYCLGCLKTFAFATGPDFAVKEHSSVIIRLSDNGLAITGYYPINSSTSKDKVVIRRVPIKNRLDSSKTDYIIEIDEWRPSGSICSGSMINSPTGTHRSSQECIIFIHGFNCPSIFAMETLGQFLALADLPNYIKPFVFSPPGTNSLWYFGSKQLSCSNEAVNDFRTFLQKLCDAGFCNIHIMAHSMGCTIALKYIKAFEGLFQTVGSSNDDDDYANLSNYCNHITIYSNSRDFALKVGEFLGNDKSLGLHTSDLYYNGKLMDVDLIDTTQLDVNIHKMRHNFFNLNRLLVDDLSDIIVFGKRARERKTRLSRKYVGHESVVYTFLVAPSYVVNK
ncbi:10348_t:CDS:2 [Cetraspora pellucida]|uniref:10348_t:CDS:1 n=1 Tax=Cetraspora pellucida TaxID=1433469 RepID=A0ACA9L6W5_9GLOM|nr:10348_t:CDS:2 [Cetraspora pellucida]